MKIIPYESKELLDLYDSRRVSEYEKKVSNANIEQFSQKIEINGVWYSVYIQEYREFYLQSEINRIITIDQND